MGVNLRHIDIGEVHVQCSDCGVSLCWCIDEFEYYEWEGFYDNWTCRDCNPNYKGAFYRYQQEHLQYEWLPLKLKKQIMEHIIKSNK